MVDHEVSVNSRPQKTRDISTIYEYQGNDKILKI